jgi:proteic killer suppression protein
MIISFGCKETEKIWNGIAVKKPALQIQQKERRKLKMRTNAFDLKDLSIAPSNRFEK